MANVYLLHFEPALAHAKHYCGYTPNGVNERVEKHRKGAGACITRAASALGITLTVSKTWHFDDKHEARLFERSLKNTHKLSRFCPICQRIAKRKAKRKGKQA